MKRTTLTLWSLALVGLSSCGFKAEERRPDVLLLVIDTLRADHLGCYGYERATSPVIDEIAESGALFSRNSSQAPWTLPSMSSMMTSRYFTAHRDFPDETVPTLVESFKAAGYHTIGIVGNPLLESEHGFGRGFDEYSILAGDLPALTERVLAPLDLVLEQGERKPIFLYVHAFDPHAPYIAHPEFDEVLPLDGAPEILPDGWQQKLLTAYGPMPPEDDSDWSAALKDIDRERGLYDQEVRFADEHTGQLLELLNARGISDSLLIAIVSDHGEGLWEHLSPAPKERLKTFAPENLFFGGHGHDLSEQALRTPFILAGPGVPAGLRLDAPVENVDLFPTLLSLCDLPRPGDLHGIDLTVLFSESQQPTAWRKETYAYIRHAVSLRDEDAQLKIVVPTEFGVGKEFPAATLHRLSDDPLERTDLSSDLPREFARLNARLEAYLDRYPTTTERVGDRVSQEQLNALGYAGQGNDEEE